MELIRQEPGTSVCGQCVVAMLCSISLAEAIEHMGTGRNYPNDIRKALKHFGRDFVNKRSEPLENGLGPLGEVGAVFIHNLPVEGRTIQHWVVWDGSQFLDPLNGPVAVADAAWTAVIYRVTCTPTP